VEDLVSRVVPAVVSIAAGSSRGTGFHFSPDRVLTNAHVVDGHSSVELYYGGTKRSGRVVTTSPATDLSLIQVMNPDPQQAVLRLGSAQTVRAGQEVIAVGSALGVLSNTVTRGIVSAIRSTGVVTLIQTDAAINPGNSGGPLVDRSGAVIGVNSLGISKKEAEAVAFAVAIDHAVQLLNGQTAATSQTPLDGLQQMMSGPSDSDRRRSAAEQRYVEVLKWAATNGDSLDSTWRRYAPSCVASAPKSGDREWFAVFDRAGVRLTGYSAYDCGAWLDSMRNNATQIKAQVDKVAEAARQAGVYPGRMRDLRRQHRLEWSGWER
jgi:hypothetical protein